MANDPKKPTAAEKAAAEKAAAAGTTDTLAVDSPAAAAVPNADAPSGVTAKATGRYPYDVPGCNPTVVVGTRPRVLTNGELARVEAAIAADEAVAAEVALVHPEED